MKSISDKDVFAIEDALGIAIYPSIVRTDKGPISDTAAELAKMIDSRDDVFDLARALIKVLRAQD